MPGVHMLRVLWDKTIHMFTHFLSAVFLWGFRASHPNIAPQLTLTCSWRIKNDVYSFEDIFTRRSLKLAQAV